MSASILRIPIKRRPVILAKCQKPSVKHPTEKPGLGVGMEYISIADRELFGPFETGCEPGRECHIVYLQKAKYGQIARCRLQGQKLLQAWYKAEDLAALFGDGADITIWPDALGQYDLASIWDKPGGILRYDRLNGYPTVAGQFDWEEYDSTSFFFSGEIDKVTLPGGMTSYVVGKFFDGVWMGPTVIVDAFEGSDGWNMDSSWNGGLKAVGYYTDNTYDGDWNIIGRRTRYFDGFAGNRSNFYLTEYSSDGTKLHEGNSGIEISMDDSRRSEIATVPTDEFHVFAIRYGVNKEVMSFFVDGVNVSGLPMEEGYPYGEDWSLPSVPDVMVNSENAEGFLTLTRPNGNLVQIRNRTDKIGIEVGWHSGRRPLNENHDLWEMAEVRWWPTAHTDAEIAANTAELRTKYGI